MVQNAHKISPGDPFSCHFVWFFAVGLGGICFRTHPRVNLLEPYFRPQGVLSKDPGVLSKDPGILSKDPGVNLKDPGVLEKDPGVL